MGQGVYIFVTEAKYTEMKCYFVFLKVENKQT